MEEEKSLYMNVLFESSECFVNLFVINIGEEL